MAAVLFLFHDDDFALPLYEAPRASDLEQDLVVAMRQVVLDVLEDEARPNGTRLVGDKRVGWKHQTRSLLTFVAAVDEDEVSVRELEEWLEDLMSTYLDEVDDPISPERGGLRDVIIDVIAPWED